MRERGSVGVRETKGVGEWESEEDEEKSELQKRWRSTFVSSVTSVRLVTARHFVKLACCSLKDPEIWRYTKNKRKEGEKIKEKMIQKWKREGEIVWYKRRTKGEWSRGEFLIELVSSFLVSSPTSASRSLVFLPCRLSIGWRASALRVFKLSTKAASPLFPISLSVY